MTILKELETPVFAAEGIPQNADPRSWQVKLKGMTAQDAVISLDRFRTMPVSTVNARLTSVSGWSVRADFTGVLWRDFIKLFPPLPASTHAIFRSPGNYTTNVPLTDLEQPHVLWCWAVGAEPLEVEYGGPLRMIIPHLWGYKSCKWVVELTYTNQDQPGFWETRGYTNSGIIEPGATLDVNTGQSKKIKGGEITDF